MIHSKFFYSSIPSFEKDIVFGCGKVPISTKGYFNLDYTILDVKLTTTFLVVDSLPEDVILGFPWFEQQLAVIDTTRKCIYFGTEQRRTIYYLQKSDQQLPQNITFALDHVDPDYKLDFKKMLVQFQDVFIDTLRQPITRTVKHDIRLSSDKIVNIKPYSMNDRKKTNFE